MSEPAMQQFNKTPEFKADKPILVMKQLCKSYQLGTMELQVLRSIDVTIKSGEYVAIMGPSGSGKSTLLNMIGCLDHPTSGEYWLGGRDVSQLNDDDLSLIRGARIGFIFQSFNLIQQLTVVENIEVPMVGLGDRITHRPTELSGGEQQRVAIARALANEPLIILADEPTGNLDSESGSGILKILHDLHEQGKTLIVVTHDESIAKDAQRTIRLFDGRIKQNGEKN